MRRPKSLKLGMGEPTKQNGEERRARLGVKPSSAAVPDENVQQQNMTNVSQDLWKPRGCQETTTNNVAICRTTTEELSAGRIGSVMLSFAGAARRVMAVERTTIRPRRIRRLSAQAIVKRGQGLLAERSCLLNNQLMIEEIDWTRIPMVAELVEARAWMTFQACRGLAENTLDAYGRNLERYLSFLQRAGVPPWDVKQDQVALYLHDLVTISVTAEKKSRLGNATIQQHLTTVRLFHEYLLEEERCKRNVFKQGSGFSSRPLVRREHKLPWIPTDEDWCRVLAVTAREPIRNRLMLAMSYDAGLRREELCSLETGDIDPSRRVIRIRADNEEPKGARTSLFGDYRRVVWPLPSEKADGQREPRSALFVRVAKEPWSTGIDLELVEGRSRHCNTCGCERVLNAYYAPSLPYGPCAR